MATIRLPANNRDNTTALTRHGIRVTQVVASHGAQSIGVKRVAIRVGARVVDPRARAPRPRVGRVLAVRTNPACLMRVLVIGWLDAPTSEPEEIEEVEFGPLGD